MKVRLIKVGAGLAVLCISIIGSVTLAWQLNLFNHAPLKWTAKLHDQESLRYVTPDVVVCAAELMAGWGSWNSMTAYARADGRELWHHQHGTGPQTWDTDSIWAFDGIRAYLRKGVFDREKKVSIDTKIASLNLLDGSTVWETAVPAEITGMTLQDGVLFVVTLDGHTAAYRSSDGSVLWQASLAAQSSKPQSYGGATRCGKALVVNRDYYTSADEARTFLLDASTGKILMETGKAVPAGSRLLAYRKDGVDVFDCSMLPFAKQTFQNVYARESADGWRGILVSTADERGKPPSWSLISKDGMPMGDRFYVDCPILAVADGIVYIHVYRSKSIVAIDEATGRKRWEIKVDKPGMMNATKDIVALLEGRGLTCRSAKDGQMLWSYPMDTSLSYPQIDGSDVVISSKGKLFYFSKARGDQGR